MHRTLLALAWSSSTAALCTCWSASNRDRLQAIIDSAPTAAHGTAPVAAFDADGTLWAGDAYDAFATVLLNRGLIDRKTAERVAEGYAASEDDERRRFLLESLELFKGLRLETLHDAAVEAWESFKPDSGEGLRDTLRPEMAELVVRLREAGWRVLIVTASPAEAVLRGAQELGVPEGDVLAIRLETDEAGVITGRPSPIMPLTWREGKAAALRGYGVADRLMLAVGNSMDDVPMIRCSRGAGMLCVPRPDADDDPWAGSAEGKSRLVDVAAQSGYLLHEAASGPRDPVFV